jgi:cell division protein FtsQ
VIVEGGIPVRRPDGHYWRRKVNRRVHRTRRLKLVQRSGGLLAVAFVILGFLGYVVAEAFERVRTSPAFALSTIRVEGTRRVSPDLVSGAIAAHVGGNLLSLDLDRIAAEVSAVPWVRKVELKRILPATLRVEVEERQPAAQAVVDGSVRVVDETGSVIGTTGPGLYYDLPVITGAERGPEDGRRILRARGVSALRALAAASPEWAAGLSEIDLAEADRIAVVSRADEPRLYLDPERPDRNLTSWLALRREIGGRLGNLDYVDLRWDGRIVARPASDPPRQGR